MTARMLRASLLSLAVLVVVAAVSVVGFFLIDNNASQQDQRLLRDQTAQAALIGSSEFDSIVSSISGIVGPVAEFDPASLQSTIAAIATSTPSVHFVVYVLRPAPGGFEAVAAAGSALAPGEMAPAPLSATLAEAEAAKSTSPISSPYVPVPVTRRGSQSTVGFASRISSSSSELMYFSFTLDPFTAASTLVGNKGPFELLRLALYGSSTPSDSSIVVATTHSIPLTGAISSKTFTVGTKQWLIVGQARSSLAGSFASVAPWVILGLGLFLAFVLAGTVEVLMRRQRYANHLVALRTQELEASLTDLRDAQEKLVRGERLSALGEMASVVGHELRNPLTAVMNALYLLTRSLDDQQKEKVQKHIDMAERETAKAAALAEDLTAFVRPRQQNLAQLDLAEVIDEVVQAAPPPDVVELEVEAPPTPVVADRGQIAEVLTNLITNAYQAMPEGGAVRLRTLDNGDGVLIVIEDEGPGIDPQIFERVFEPFFTTKASGTGLGLAIVRRLVEAHGGEISISNGMPCGTRVTVRLPENENEEADGVRRGSVV